MTFTPCIATFQHSNIPKAMSAIGRYVTTMLDQEQQLYSQNLAIACELLGISRGRHGMQVYCMEREISRELQSKLEMLADANHLDSSRPKALLDSLVDNEEQWNVKLITTRSFQKVTARQRKRERQEIADFLLDVSRIFQMRQTLIRSFKVGVVGPTKSGKSKFLSSLGRRSGADAMKHTLDITAHWFKPDNPKVADADDRLVLIDFPGYDDTGTRVGEAFARHHNICDAYLFVVQIDKIDTPELQGRFQSAVASGRPVCCCLNKADTALMKEAPLPDGVADGTHASNQKVHRGFEAEITTRGSGIPRVPRPKAELWEDVREKIESLLQNVAQPETSPANGDGGGDGDSFERGSSSDAAGTNVAGAGASASGLVVPAEEVHFDMRESNGGFLKFGQTGSLRNLTVVLTTFDRREWAADITPELVEQSEIVSASKVFDCWVLESMQQHCGSPHANASQHPHFCRKDVMESVFHKEDGETAPGGGSGGGDAAADAAAEGAAEGAAGDTTLPAAGGSAAGTAAPYASLPLTKWSISDVLEWATDARLHFDMELLKEAELEGPDLLEIDDETLQSDFGVTSKLQRKKILRKLGDLREKGGV